MVRQNRPKAENYGRGKFRFILGHGSSGVFGHVELSLQIVPKPGQCSVQWEVESNNRTFDARERVEAAASKYLRDYVSQRPECGFLVTITEVTSDPGRRNDYERATTLALRFALEEIGLPVPRIFGP